MNRTTLSITAQCVLCIDTTDTISDVGLPHSNVRHKRVQDVIESLPIPEQYITLLNQSTANNHQVSLVGVPLYKRLLTSPIDWESYDLSVSNIHLSG